MMIDDIQRIIVESWSVLGQMSPWLLFGFLVAGILSVCISPELVERHLGGSGLWPVIKASFFGVPLPLCSCGVIPVAASIRRHGASRAATTSFLLSTPQTGVDSIAITYAMLGPVFAAFRPVAAFATGLIGGVLVRFFGEPNVDSNPAASSGSIHNAKTGSGECRDSCCSGDKREGVPVRIFKHAFITLPKDIGFALLVGVLVAGTISAFVDPGAFSAYLGGGIVAILIMMAAGIPVYVCATASVPIAAGFMHMGASAGAALAFLIAGPATNAATIATVWKIMGKRTAVIYVATVALSAILCGLVLDALTLEFAAKEMTHAHESGGWYYHVAAVAMLAVFAVSYFCGRTGGAEAVEKRSDVDGKIILKVSGMTCDHCSGAVRKALLSCTGVEFVEVNLQAGIATVGGREADPGELIEAVKSCGYEASIEE